MTSRKGRIARRIFRWACRLLALVVLAILACAIYLERAGLPEFLKRRLVASVRAKGWEFDYSRLRFHWQRGIIGENIQLRPAEKKPGPFLFVEEAACQLNRRALRNFEIEVDSVLLRGGRLVWQFAATNEPTATFQLDRIGGELIFAANDLWRLQSLSAEMLGTEMQVSGTLTNASRIRDWKLPKGSRSAEATQALWRRIVSTAGKVKFTGQPQLITHLNGDAAELRSLDADLKFAAAAVQTPWGSATNPVLRVRIFPAQTNEPLQTDFELVAERALTTWGSARKLRLNWEVEAPFTSFFPTNAHIAVDLVGPETSWGKARHVVATVHRLPLLDSGTPFRTEVQATVEQFQSEWVRSDFARVSTALQHSATNLLPATVSTELHLSKATSKWGETLGAEISASGSLPPADQVALWKTNLLWTERLSNVLFHCSINASNLSSTNLQLASGSLKTGWDSRNLTLQTALGLYGGTLTATAQVDSVTREAVFAANSKVDPYEIAALLTPKARDWLSNYTWKAAPIVSCEGRVVLPAWTNQHPNWVQEVRPSLELAGHFQLGEGAYREVPFTAASSPFTLTNLFWHISDLLVVRPEGRLHGEYSTAFATRDFHWSVHSEFDPKIVRRLLTNSVQQKVLDDFQFSAPPVIVGDLWSSWEDRERLGFVLQVRGTNLIFRGESIAEVSTGLHYTNKLLTFVEPRVRQGTNEGRAPKILIDFATQRLYLTNATGDLNPQAVARAIGKQPGEAIAPYRFDSPPYSTVNGIVDLKKGRHEDDLHFVIYGGPFRWQQFRLQKLSGNVDWIGDKLSLNHLEGGFTYGGIAGAAAFDFTRGESPTFGFNLGLTEADLRTFMPEIGYPTNKLEGLLNGELLVLSAKTSDPKSWQGKGKLRLNDGLIWNLPMFGAFSPVLNSIAPGLGNSRAKEMTADFVITNSLIVSHNVEIRATAMRMSFDGSVTFNGDVEATAEAELLRDVPAIGFVISKVLWPITKLFEYKVTGTLNHPQTEPLYIIPKLLLLPLQPFKMLKEMIPESSKPAQP